MHKKGRGDMKKWTNLLCKMHIVFIVCSNYSMSFARQTVVSGEQKKQTQKNNDTLPDRNTKEMATDIQNNNPVHKKVLKNGLTILVHSTHTIPKVSLQIWYNVGSKDEKSGEKGTHKGRGGCCYFLADRI